MRNLILIVLILYLGWSCTLYNPGETLAKKKLNDPTFTFADTMARKILKKGLYAGSGYSQVWARDMNTFFKC